jgi:hypothetical protein
MVCTPSRRGGRQAACKSAAGDNTQRWEPDPAEQYYWPPTIPRAYSVSAFIQAYQTHHYEVCGDGLQERGYEKIVIYATALES